MVETESNDLQPLLSTAQTAAYLNKHPNTIRRYAREKRIPFIRIGGEIRFRKADLQAWVDLHTSTVEAEPAA